MIFSESLLVLSLLQNYFWPIWCNTFLFCFLTEASFNLDFDWLYAKFCRLSWKLLLKPYTMNYWQRFSKIHCPTCHLIIVEILLSNRWFLMPDVKIMYVPQIFSAYNSVARYIDCSNRPLLTVLSYVAPILYLGVLLVSVHINLFLVCELHSQMFLVIYSCIMVRWLLISFSVVFLLDGVVLGGTWYKIEGSFRNG